MKNTAEIFGENVFSESVMKERLPKETFKEVKNAIYNGHRLSQEAANVVANEMKQWAIEKGCTHYTHWFQPMTGISREARQLHQPRRRRQGNLEILRQGTYTG